MTISILLKLTGACLLLPGCSGLGFWFAGNYRRHLAEVEQLRRMLFLLKGQILYANAPLEEAFRNIGEKAQGELGTFFCAVADRIEQQQGEAFYEMWKEEIEKLGPEVLLNKKDRHELLAFGEHLGFLDREMQERTILLYLEQLDLVIEDGRANQKEKSRLYSSLGIMGGLFLVIILC